MATKMALLLIITTLATTAATAQEFEVASVRTSPRSLLPALPGAMIGSRLHHPPGRFVVRNWSLRALIAYAYGLPQVGGGDVFLLRGGADAILGRAFDVEAILPRSVDSVSIAEERAMLRSLLTHRFGLRIHRERQKLPVYALRREGEKLGQHLRRISEDCTSWRTQRLAPPTDADGNGVCRPWGGFDRAGGGFGYALRDFGDLAYLVERVQGYVDRAVVNETGLTGQFAWELTFTPVLGGVTPKTPLVYPYIYTAIQEQLGLKLVPGQADVDVMVIDVLSMPTPN